MSKPLNTQLDQQGQVYDDILYVLAVPAVAKPLDEPRLWEYGCVDTTPVPSVKGPKK